MERAEFYRLSGVILDLAVEAHALLRGATRQEVPGVKEDKEQYPNATVTTITIMNATGEQAMGKPLGTYITIDAPALRFENPPVHEEIAGLLAQKLNLLLEKWNVGPTDSVLVVGLGNWEATPDSLGPKVINQFTVTRHLLKFAPQNMPPGTRPVSALAPGVLGTTGIETAEILKGVVEKTRPRVLIAIDALAAGDLQRIGSSIQITDTGISPGSGVGNQRVGINRQTMGVPVIAIGIPTVVHAGVIIYEALNQMQQAFPHVNLQLDQAVAQNLTRNVLAPFGGNLTVTPKEVDDLVHNLAWVIGNALNRTLHSALLQARAAIPLH
ncbi:MAG: spore protease [Moorella sp. (in: firmicutes)]|uniref:GPR endopeptidase n=1 Tax=unclassified Neomoorella TaxID=2676739 RepID=UPI0010FFBA70|nr:MULTISPECIES: GPR endopeptidase [unclassified Moorella (in: firmicutes)]MDK2815620.1 spore protease [Moorella sp. (in: firmicutes)]MDK2894194.1 spore protease [Moorella sp. (in: firmicutes)]GEA15107.1 germination protease [Moorella sp. E308F]GEA16982.1 germination protease [Moorella sp. E306M]